MMRQPREDVSSWSYPPRCAERPTHGRAMPFEHEGGCTWVTMQNWTDRRALANNEDVCSRGHIGEPTHLSCASRQNGRTNCPRGSSGQVRPSGATAAAGAAT